MKLSQILLLEVLLLLLCNYCKNGSKTLGSSSSICLNCILIFHCSFLIFIMESRSRLASPGVRAGSVRGSVRYPCGVRARSVRIPYGFRSKLRGPFGVRNPPQPKKKPHPPGGLSGGAVAPLPTADSGSETKNANLLTEPIFCEKPFGVAVKIRRVSSCFFGSLRCHGVEQCCGFFEGGNFNS